MNIAAALPSPVPAEQRVADLILRNPQVFARLPVLRWAERAHIGKRMQVQAIARLQGDQPGAPKTKAATALWPRALCLAY